MKNKYFFLPLSVFVSFFWLQSSAQNLSFKELIELQRKKYTEVEKYLETKNEWKYSDKGISEDFHNYKYYKWAYNKNEYSETAESWLTFYTLTGYENAILYKIPSNIYYDIKKNVESDTHWSYVKKVVEGNLISVFFIYKNYYLVFCSDNYNSEYYLRLYNKTDIANLEKIEIAKELERKKLDSIANAEAIQKEAIYQSIISKADSLLILHNLTSAKQLYNEALKIKPDESYPSSKIIEINKIYSFLEERKYKIYDYKEINLTYYNKISDALSKNIKELYAAGNYTGTVKVELIYKIDTLGKNKFESLNTEVANQDILNNILSIAKNYELLKAYKNNYIVNAKATYNIEVKLDEKTYHVKKNNVEIKVKEDPNTIYKSEINKLISNSDPIGKYTVSIHKREINSVDYSNNKIVKFKGIGGPSNMFLSILVPGLGDKSVSGGTKSGLPRTLVTYGLIGVGVGCKFLSISEYDKYHKAITQPEMDLHYNYANSFNKAFYYIAAAGAIVWIYDIIWVANKGYENKKKQKSYKNTLSFNVNADFKNLSYIIKF